MNLIPARWLGLLMIGGLGFKLRAQTNLLLNPGLEAPFISAGVINVSGVLATNWTASAVQGARLDGVQETMNVHGGSNCQEIVVTGLNATNEAMFYEVFAYQPGSVYNGKVWLRAAASSPVQFELRGSNDVHHTFQAGASHIVTVDTNWQPVIINGGWQNGSYGQFAINFLTNGTFWIDDAGLSDVTSNYLHAPLANPTSSVPATLFGMHINQFTAPNNWPPLQQGVVRFWDIGIHWNQVETNTNTFIWAGFDASTNIVRINNPSTKVIYTLGQTPAWAALTTNTPTAKNGPGASSEPRDMNDWSNYVQTVALRYKGAIQFYEVWNETDSTSYYTGAISNMVTMAQIARGILTNIDPTIKILGPNITLGGLGWLEQFILAGGPPPDIVTFHDYVESQPETSLGEIVGLRDLLAHYPEWSALPVWCTEGAASTNDNPEADAGIVSRAYLFWWTQNVQNWCWYTWDKGASAGYVPLSINPPSKTPAAGGVAYSNTANWLVGAQMTSLTIDTNGTWITALQRLGATNAYVVWNPNSNAVVNIPANWNVYQQRDLSNDIVSLTGATALTAGVAPVILDSLPSLTITPPSSGTNLVISWPLTASGFVLDQSHVLGSTNVWMPVTNLYATNADAIRITVSPVPATNTFYRLIETTTNLHSNQH